ncbi:MAG: hypothetical protein AAB947_01045, partial [Patescibacteria group bacterium]
KSAPAAIRWLPPILRMIRHLIFPHSRVSCDTRQPRGRIYKRSVHLFTPKTIRGVPRIPEH